MWKFSEAVRSGEMSVQAFAEAERGMARSKGFCNTMGTASTMACLVEAMGLTLSDNGAIPAVDSRRYLLAHMTGRRIVEMVRADLRLSAILRRPAFENAVRACAALGGSTNAVLHLLALAGRAGVRFDLDDWDRLGRGIPVIADLMPSGRYLMEDFSYAGGLPALLHEMGDLIDGTAPTVSGRTLGEEVAGARVHNAEVIRPLERPVAPDGGIAVLRGNLCPDGAVLKPGAASPRLMQHRGRAVVFSSIEDFYSRIDDEALAVDDDAVLVLQNCGPCGYPGMPEAGNMQLPRKLLRRGVTDMVRISDCRMSGTAYGTVVLHVAPEAAVGGPLALVRDGDLISLDVAGRRLDLEVPEAELARRREAWQSRRAGSGPAATSGSTWITCCRPTAAPTSTSWWGRAGTRCAAMSTDPAVR